MRVFVALLSSLEFHTFPSACQVPLANPILLSTPLSDPSCVLIFPPRYTKFSVCSNSCPSTSTRNFLFPSPRNWHSVFCMLIFMPIFLAHFHGRNSYREYAARWNIAESTLRQEQCVRE